ncbi:hypothetical protein UFOVP181_342 [uncultured Caudovirales phage]|uniref:Baseplate hub assembly protein, bacteriophage T4-like n=1 Tax=uncultured Caudovirales phage TaxID=2100421 RepID=A0A6J7WJ74_9CAUD|nr:hypothetical protein UFOVP57_297 [uncultured Caudovirales phage]CAB5209163.1 hypothetical protein UFOVP181_342 [uncultured Caudovirales phage]
MAQNPLQQYFRQPKIFIGLPSHGAYNKPGTISGDPERLAVFGMTGMDEILLKTPDALLSGESTVKVINSCVPSITDPWDLSTLDADLVLSAIRIATYGNELNIMHVCNNCGTENEYTLDVNTMIDHYATCTYNNKLVLKDLTIITRPLTYQQSTDFALQNFQYQQKLKNIDALEDDTEKKTLMGEVFNDLAELRNAVYSTGIESINAGAQVVDQREFIIEFLNNCDKEIIDSIAKHVDQNQKAWAVPDQKVICENCGTENEVSVDLDQSNFFVTA